MIRQILIVKFINIHSSMFTFIYIHSSIQLFNSSIAQSLHMMENPYIHYIHLFDRSISTHCIHQKKVFGQPYLSVWRQWREEEAGIATAADETGLSGVDGGGGDRQSRVRWGVREFVMKSKMTRGGLLFIGSKISARVLN
jgi:hypothetical protein